MWETSAFVMQTFKLQAFLQHLTAKVSEWKNQEYAQESCFLVGFATTVVNINGHTDV
jgi:uncharacterized membrane protein